MSKKKKKIVNREKEGIEGIFIGHPKGFGFVKTEKEEEQDIYIPFGKTKNALDGDKVLVKVIDKTDIEDLRKEGIITEILKHETSTLVGLFQNSKNFGFVIPDNQKFGTDIYISKNNFGKAKNNSKVVVKITKYPENSKKAEGRIIEVLGGINEAGVDMLSLIKEYDVPYKFPREVIEEAKQVEEEVSKEEIASRVDLREKEIFTIDGEDSKDLDDAVCVEKTEKGTYILGVHIADVSHYVKEKTNLDNEAVKRGTSIYMMDRVIPMLPKELSNGICSLNSGKDRLALSAIMEINKQGEVVSANIKKTVINVTRRMTYTNVTKILEETDAEVLNEYKEYAYHFKLMEELALILKARRDKEGCLNLDFPESKIILDENGVAVDIKRYPLSISNQIVEEFMLTANEVVAEKFFTLKAPFIYRVHEVPEIDRVKELNQFIYGFGYEVKIEREKIAPKDFARVLEEIKGKPEERIISNGVLRTLKVAKYESNNKGHFGLASKYYCHFTSPIRRYPDLFIHRIISMYLSEKYNVQEDIINKYSKKATKYAESSSEKEKIAQKIERDSIDIKKAEYMQDKIGMEYSRSSFRSNIIWNVYRT